MSVPSYYLGKDGQPAWNVVENWGLNFNTGSAWTYISRAGRKTPDPREDLRKAINMLEREIECFEKGWRK